MTLPDKDDIDSYGGEKSDYAPIEDPTTDTSADEFNALKCSVAMGSRTAVRAWVRFTTHATTPGLVAHDAVWGNSVAVQPTIARSGAGVFTVTWPTTVDDELGESHSLNLQAALVTVNGSTCYFSTCSITSANVATVYTFNTLFAANDIAGTTITVFAL